MGWLTGLPIKMYLYAGIALLVVGLGLAVKIQTSRLDSCKEAAAAFKAVVKAEGEAAAKEAARVNLVNSKAMEAAHERIKVLSANNAVLIKRLRSNNPPQSRLPPPPSNTKRPDLLCLDRETYQREDGILIAKLFEGARSLADEGTTHTLKLSTAVEWAKSIHRSP
jgi:hypothetical protein